MAAQDNASIFDILDKKFIDSVKSIIYDDELKPEKNIQTKGHITGWIDIVGFKNMTCFENNCYVPGNIIDSMIIKHDRDHTIRGAKWWNWGVEDIYSNVDSTEINGAVEATLTVHLVYYRAKLICNPICHIRKQYFHETQTFTDTKTDIPDIFEFLNLSVPVQINIYNNSINPKTVITIPEIPSNTIKINYTYETENITHYFAIGSLEYTKKNVPFMNITKNDFWIGGLGDGGNMTRIGNDVVLNTANFYPKNLTIEISDSYRTQKLDNFTIETIEWHGLKDTINPIFYLVVGTMVIFIFGIYSLVRSLRYG